MNIFREYFKWEGVCTISPSYSPYGHMLNTNKHVNKSFGVTSLYQWQFGLASLRFQNMADRAEILYSNINHCF